MCFEPDNNRPEPCSKLPYKTLFFHPILAAVDRGNRYNRACAGNPYTSGHHGIQALQSNFGESRVRPSVIATARTLGTVYLVLTLISLTLLLFSGMSFYESVCHTLSAISTGGFSTQAESIGAYEGFLIPFFITISCIMGAISFSLYPEVLKNPKTLIRDPQVRYMLGLSILGTALFALTLSGGNSGPEMLGILPDAVFRQSRPLREQDSQL